MNIDKKFSLVAIFYFLSCEIEQGASVVYGTSGLYNSVVEDMGGLSVISFERWKDGFVMTVEGVRVLKHSSSTPAFFLGALKEKIDTLTTGGSRKPKDMTWSSLGACKILNEGPELTALSFASACMIRILYADRVLRLRFSLPAGTQRGMRIRFGAHPKEGLFGAGPSTLYDMKNKKIEMPAVQPGATLRRNPSILSTLGTWMHIDGNGGTIWRSGASFTEVTCFAAPEEIALGFGKTPAMGMELLTRYRAGTSKDATGSGPRARFSESLQKSLVFIAEACGRPLPPGSSGLKSAAELVRTILSLSLSGEGQVFLPIEERAGNASAREEGAAVGSAFTAGTATGPLPHSFEIAAFGPLFLLNASLDKADDVTAHRFAAAVTIYEMLAPYREYCSKEWVEKGIPVLAHPALYYEGEDQLWKFDDQYMFGPDLIVAPTLEGEASARQLFLPDDEWIHLWTSRSYPKGKTVVDAPGGKPAVFYRRKSAFAQLFDEIRQKATRL